MICSGVCRRLACPIAPIVLLARHWAVRLSNRPDRPQGVTPSRLVLEAKNDADKAAQVAAIFAQLAERPSWRQSRPTLVVSVPPAPDSDFDRFATARAVLSQAIGARDGDGVLGMNFTVDNYKQLPHDARRVANEGRFRAIRLNGEHVLLIDDVLTSGGQAEACRDALLAGGAAKVNVIALAATQDPLPEACPICGASLRIYHRQRDGQAFVGCPNYFTSLRCPYTRSV